MLCYVPGAGVAWLVVLGTMYYFRAVIEKILYYTWVLGGFAAKALVATAAMAALSGIVLFIAWSGHRVRAWRAARGHCTTCTHPCTEGLDAVTARQVLISPPAIPVHELLVPESADVREHREAAEAAAAA